MSVTVKVRVPESELATWQLAAHSAGLDLSKWIRHRCSSEIVATPSKNPTQNPVLCGHKQPNVATDGLCPACSRKVRLFLPRDPYGCPDCPKNQAQTPVTPDP